jgi:RNA recognition motif-containing protein
MLYSVTVSYLNLSGHILCDVCSEISFGEFSKLSKKLYVGNLSFDATEDSVRELFGQYGTLESVAMITDRDTGRFRGFCFVEMSPSEADAAVQALDNYMLDGRNLRVNEAKPREDRGGGGGNRRSGGGGGGYGGGGGSSRRW